MRQKVFIRRASIPGAKPAPAAALAIVGRGPSRLGRAVRGEHRLHIVADGGSAMLCSLAASLRDEQISEIKALERSLGVPVLAFACHDAAPAELTDEKVGELHAVEERLGVSLVAVKE